MKPLHYYYLGVGAWFMSYGVQAVGFSWIVTILLNESAKMVGIAQTAFLTPAMLLMLIGGSLADQLGAKRLVIIGHLFASSAPLMLSLIVLADLLSYTTVIIYAVIIGSAQALITPARDGLLVLVADGRIQKRVVQVSMIQFGVQMIGFAAAAMADRLGILFILGFQFTCLLLGSVAYYKLALPATAASTSPRTPGKKSMLSQIYLSILEGFRTVKRSPDMTAIVLQNCAVGIFFMGSYVVTIPLLIRELYDGSAVEISWINMANSLGLVVTIVILMRFGDIHRQGRALLIAHGLGCVALGASGLGLGLPGFIGAIFAWGLCGGIAMTMSRTVMQEKAPENQRARMMAFYSFAFMGSGPIGAILCGYLVQWCGPSAAIVICSSAMLCVTLLVSLRSPLWALTSGPGHAQ